MNVPIGGYCHAYTASTDADRMLSLLKRPPQSSRGAERSVNADDDARFDRTQRQHVGVPMDHRHRAMGILDALITDRSQEQFFESALASSSDNQEIS